jgi:hypothetical protein
MKITEEAIKLTNRVFDKLENDIHEHESRLYWSILKAIWEPQIHVVSGTHQPTGHDFAVEDSQ